MTERRRLRQRPAGLPSGRRLSKRGPRSWAILVLSGPNLQLLGTREPAVYGKETLAAIQTRLESIARDRGARVECRQSNHEGELCDWLGHAPSELFDGVLINAGAYTHTSLALYDAIRHRPADRGGAPVESRRARLTVTSRSSRRLASARWQGSGRDSYVLALRGLLSITLTQSVETTLDRVPLDWIDKLAYFASQKPGF
jgi:3-dehydroquinate dehydratase-2